jgi:hypothetical protein
MGRFLYTSWPVNVKNEGNITENEKLAQKIRLRRRTNLCLKTSFTAIPGVLFQTWIPALKTF